MPAYGRVLNTNVADNLARGSLKPANILGGFLVNYPLKKLIGCANLKTYERKTLAIYG